MHTRASGKVVPSKQIQVIQNLEGGIVKEILVKQGDIVHAGDVLVKLDKTQFDADFNRNEAEYFMLKSALIRLKAESQFQEPVLVIVELLWAPPLHCHKQKAAIEQGP